MQIHNVLSGHADPAMKRQAELIDAVAGRLLGETSKPEPAGQTSATDAARSVLEKYDVTRITPKQVTQMIQRLFDTGALTQKEYEQLAAIRLDLDSAGIEPDEPIDLLHFYREKIDDVHRRATKAASVPDALLKRLDWVEKFALVQATAGTQGLDEVA